ncbi:MAG: sugar phosphate nucleotidyltransferase [Alphaproteobacteria bacterium]
MGMEKAINIAPVILIDRPSSRIGAFSVDKMPSSFCQLLYKHSLFQKTVLRSLVFQSPIIVCHESYHGLVQKQLEEIQVKPRSIILETDRKGSAAAISLSAFYLKNQGEIMLVLPSDHVLDNSKFEACVYDALDNIHDNMVIFGSKPSRGENWYGYLSCDEKNEKLRKVESYVEKPDQAYLRALFDEEYMFWNTGIFLSRPRVYLDELKGFEPEIYKLCQRAFYAGQENGDVYEINTDDYANILPMSVGYAVLEMSTAMYMYEMSVSWKDLGRWPKVVKLKVQSFFKKEKHRMQA